MNYQPRTAAQINEARHAALVAGTPIAPMGRCHMCDWPVASGVTWCSKLCANDHGEEQQAYEKIACT